jgi:transposase
MRPTSEAKKRNIKHYLENGESVRQVAEKVGVSKSMVQKIGAELNLSGPKLKGGRVGKLSKRNKTFCVRSVVKDGKTNAREVKQALQESVGVVVSVSTIRRALQEAGLVSFVKPKKPLLRVKNIQDRLRFAKSHLNWTLDDWRRVVWSDETKISRFGSDGQHYTWKRIEERVQPKHVKQVVKHGGSSLMVWGCITYDGPGYLTKIDSILDKELYKEILETELVYSLEWYDYETRKVIFQHDNDPKHKSKLVTEYLQDQAFTTMVWPAQSPDLNPIENIWALVKLRLFRNYDAPPRGIHELWDRIQEVWNSLTVEDCRKVIDSMPKRCRDVIKEKGYWINY